MRAAVVVGPCLALVAACAAADDPNRHEAPADAPNGGGDGGDAHNCAGGQLATDISGAREVTCAPIEAPTQQAMDERCSVYLGSRDSCDGCTTTPAKWGRASGQNCLNGLGADGVCIAPDLGGAVVQTLGIGMDGDVNGDDKLYSSLHCTTMTAAPSTAPCKAGEFVTGYDGSAWTCAPIASTVVEYVRTNCALYAGWQDGCDGCTNPPAKWGFSSDAGCTNGAGTDNTCTVASLGGETINLFGLNTDNDVNDDDKFHMALHCKAPMPASGSSTMACPPGQYVAGTIDGTTFRCESAAPLIAQFVTSRCQVYFGWRDGCDGCLAAPSKWGRVKSGGCTLGTGVNSTCSTFTLGGQMLEMLGINLDGDADQNDTFYVGLQCR